MAPDNAEHQRAWRDRERGTPPRTPEPCPSWQAFKRHRRNPDDECSDSEGCAQAMREYNADAKRRSRWNKHVYKVGDRAFIRDTSEPVTIEQVGMPIPKGTDYPDAPNDDGVEIRQESGAQYTMVKSMLRPDMG